MLVCREVTFVLPLIELLVILWIFFISSGKSVCVSYLMSCSETNGFENVSTKAKVSFKGKSGADPGGRVPWVPPKLKKEGETFHAGTGMRHVLVLSS